MQQPVLPRQLLIIVKHAEVWALFSGWPSTNREVGATFEPTQVGVYACACVSMCTCDLMWLYGCEYVCLWEPEGRKAQKRPFLSPLTPGSVRPTRRSVYLGVRGRDETAATSLSFCVLLSSLNPSRISFSLVHSLRKNRRELFVLETQVKSLCFVLFFFFFTK